MGPFVEWLYGQEMTPEFPEDLPSLVKLTDPGPGNSWDRTPFRRSVVHARGEAPERLLAAPYRTVLMPDEAYQDLRQESGWDFLQDHMGAILMTCERCGKDAGQLTPAVTPEGRVTQWLCPSCEGGKG